MRYEEAAYAYLQCLAIDPKVTSARTALAKVREEACYHKLSCQKYNHPD